MCLRVTMQKDPSWIPIGSQFLIRVFTKFVFTSNGASSFVVWLKYSDTGGLKTITVRIIYLFAFQIWCCELCVENQCEEKGSIVLLIFLQLSSMGDGLVGRGGSYHVWSSEIASFCFVGPAEIASFARWLVHPV